MRIKGHSEVEDFKGVPAGWGYGGGGLLFYVSLMNHPEIDNLIRSLNEGSLRMVRD